MRISPLKCVIIETLKSILILANRNEILPLVKCAEAAWNYKSRGIVQLKSPAVLHFLKEWERNVFCKFGVAGADPGIFNRGGTKTFQEEKQRCLRAHPQSDTLSLQK